MVPSKSVLVPLVVAVDLQRERVLLHDEAEIRAFDLPSDGQVRDGRGA